MIKQPKSMITIFIIIAAVVLVSIFVMLAVQKSMKYYYRTPDQYNGSAIKKICSERPYEIEITEYNNPSGEVGGYTEVANPAAGIADTPEILYDKDGNRVGLWSFFSDEKNKEDFDKKLSEIQKNFPNKKIFSCEKK